MDKIKKNIFLIILLIISIALFIHGLFLIFGYSEGNVNDLLSILFAYFFNSPLAIILIIISIYLFVKNKNK